MQSPEIFTVNKFGLSSYLVPMIAAGGIWWAYATPIPAIPAQRRLVASDEMSAADSGIDDQTDRLLAQLLGPGSVGPLRRTIAPPIAEEHPVVKPVVPRVVQPPPPPPLVVNLTLVGTVLDTNASHAVLRDGQGTSIILGPGDDLPESDGTIILKSIDLNSVIFARGPQELVLKVKSK